MKSLVAICDILGFADYVYRNREDLGFVASRLGWIRQAAALALLEKTRIEKVPPLEELQKSSAVGVACFSDTFFFFTKQDTHENCVKLLNTVAALIFLGLSDEGTRIRAGLAYGEVEIDLKDSVFAGVPIIEAHRLERNQLWSGGALAPSAIDRVAVPSGVYTEKPFADWKLIRYDVPLRRDSPVRTDLAVDWTMGIHKGEILRWSSERPEPSTEDWLERHEVCEKWANTKKFHDSVG